MASFAHHCRWCEGLAPCWGVPARYTLLLRRRWLHHLRTAAGGEGLAPCWGVPARHTLLLRRRWLHHLHTTAGGVRDLHPVGVSLHATPCC